jgi:dihydroflavonol-4-reductase
MRVLVTGGTGQIGSALVTALRDRGDDVRCLVRSADRLGQLDPEGVALAVGDVTDPSSLTTATKGMDAVIHAAGVVSYWSRTAALQEQVNVGGTRNVLDAAAFAGVQRVLLTSSIAALGWAPEGEIGDEDTPFNWGGMGLGYQETKRAAQDLVLGDLRVEGVAVNPGITFGAGDVHRNAGRMLMQVHQGGPPAVPSGATTVASLCDVVDGHLAALDRGTPHRSYVLGGATPTFLELYGAVAAVVGRPAPTRIVGRGVVKVFGALGLARAAITGTEPAVTPGLAEVSSRNRRYSSQRAIDELGYAPKPLAHGIQACWEWYVEHGYV